MVHDNNECHVIIVHVISVTDKQTQKTQSNLKNNRFVHFTCTWLVTKGTEMVDSVPSQVSIAESSHNHVLAVILWLTLTLSASVSQRHNVRYAKSANLSKFLS